MNHFAGAKRIVFKVGTSTLTHETGKLNLRRMRDLARVLSDLKNAGREIVLVSSGAIGVGVGNVFLISSLKKTGKEDILARIDTLTEAWHAANADDGGED